MRTLKTLVPGLVLCVALFASGRAWAGGDDLCTAIDDLAKGWTLVSEYIDEAAADHEIGDAEGEKIDEAEKKLQEPTAALVKLIKKNTKHPKLLRLADDLAADLRKLDNADEDNTWDDDITFIKSIVKTLKKLSTACKA